MNFSSLRAEDLRLNCAPTWHDCAPDWSWRPRPIPDFDFWFVARGNGTVELENAQISLSRGTFFLWQRGDSPVASQNLAAPLRVFFCHFELPGAPRELFEIPRPLQLRDLGFFENVAHRAQTLWNRSDASNQLEARRLLVSLLHLVCDEAQSPSSPHDLPLEKLRARLESEFSRPWNLDEMARETHLSRSQLARRFRANFGASPLEFLGKTRLENARRLLLESDWPLEKIARFCGFCDGAHLSNAFKKSAKIAPASLRKRR